MTASISGIAPDDQARFADLYRAHHKLVQAYCARRIGPHQVADAVSETFLVAWRKLDEVPAGDATLPWLYGVAFRVLSHQWRYGARRHRLLERLGGVAQPEVPPVEIVVMRNEEHRMILEAASRLRHVDQEILRLTLWEELSHADAAAVLGIEEGAAKQRAARARRNLGEEYRKMTGDRPSISKGGTR